ncbi:MAG TPA: SCP2 sterol-binding domain-containing protein [Candidatus Acidoferrales bacterium]|nr:SCP2 sterol-binding domain-containing protein [Candidatus Acidoferrales bacterium]
MQLDDHPTVKRFQELNAASHSREAPQVVDREWLRQVCLEAGADDVGFVAIDRAEIADQKADILWLLPQTKALISFVVRMNRENIRTPARSIANIEFHHTTDEINEVARKIAAAMERTGIRAVNGGAAGFPMEADRWGSKMWVVSHKPVAVAAGLGQMGIHRNVIHPKFGNFISLGTVLMDAEVSEYSRPIEYNPCLECKMCVAACPTGAIGSDGRFDFSACYTHNYREFMGGFNDWVEQIAESKSALDYRKKVSSAESVSMWQSLSFGANYKAAYCLSVCPAGEDVIAPFLTDRKEFLKDVVRPLQDKVETVYVVRGSDAEDYVARRFPQKKTKRVSNGLAGQGTIRGFLRGLNFVFQRGKSEGMNATYHFTFTGQEDVQATVVIRDKTLQVSEGHIGVADLRLTANSEIWLRFVRREANLVWALVRRKIRIHGSPRLLLAFARCFPS